MLKLTRTGIGLLTRQYRSVLKKCFLINAGLFFALAPAVANAESKSHIDVKGNETVTLIEGEFENLNASSGVIDPTRGGAIYNAGTIDNIYADFTNNKAESASNQALGGAIFNAGTINNIYADFVGNYASSFNYSQGGAIFNSGGTIDNLSGRFINNYTSSSDNVAGSTIFNADGSITINDSIFRNDVYDNHTIYGYKNSTTTINNSIAENIGFVKDEAGTMNINSLTGRGVNFTLYNVNPVLNITNSTLDGLGKELIGISALTPSTINIVDTTIKNYKQTSSWGVAIGSGGTLNITAKDKDVLFRNNLRSGLSTYSDIYSFGTVNLNATQSKSVDFGGSWTYKDGTTPVLNINQGSQNVGGDYIFRNYIEGYNMNLYDGANVQLRNLRQADGTVSVPNLNLTGFTSTGAGNILDVRDLFLGWKGRTNYQPVLGAVTLNNNTNLRLAVDGTFSPASAGDYLEASSFSGSGKFQIDYIDVHDKSSSLTSALIANDTLKSHIEMASTYHVFDKDYKDNFTVTYNAGTGYLNFTPKTGTLNLVGYLSNASSTATTPYNMTSDEPVLRNISAMTGTTKTVNAQDAQGNNYTINGNGFGGVVLGAGQTLNINGGVWDGFVSGGAYSPGVFDMEDGGSLYVKGAVFQNNNTASRTTGGAVLDQNGKNTYSEFVDSDFYNNTVPGSTGHGIIYTSGVTHIKTNTKDSTFKNNISEGRGGVFHVSGENEAEDCHGKLYVTAEGNHNINFVNNTANNVGGVIINESETTISATGGDVIFKNNTAGTSGGAIYNAGTLDISAATGHKVKFEGNNINTSALRALGGAIYNIKQGNNNNIIADFIDNYIVTAGYATGGAIANQGENDVAAKIGTIKGNFTGNYIESTATDDYYVIGGAISNDTYGSRINRIEGTFTNNHATGYRAFGGAIYQYGNSSIGDIVANFLDNYIIANTTYGFGGAIHLGYGSVNSISGTFGGNYVKVLGNTDTSIGKGGAISNENDSSITTLSGTFTDNYVTATTKVAQGGALHNEGTISNLTNSTFSGNYVSGNDDSKGGAIYNSGDIGFSGTNIFTNNKANEVPNDIYNAGTININGGTTTLNSGYIGSETSALTVKSGATLTANAALEVADGGTLTNESGGTLAVSADNLKIDETTNNGTLELEGGNVTTKLMGTGRMKLMSGNVRLLSSTPPATTGSLSFGSSSDYADSILTFSSAASTSDHALVTAGYLDNNYYMNYGDSMAKSFIKAANDNHKNVIVRSAKHDVTIFGRQSDNTATTTKQAA